MPKNLEITLFPKRSGLINKNKPQVLIVSSPYDKQDSAVHFKGAKAVLEANGYSVINRKPIDFTAKTVEVKPWVGKGKRPPITLWLEAHGLPGYLFGNKSEILDELLNLYYFLEFISKLEAASGAEVERVVLSCCYSAAEHFNPITKTGFCSPSRLLSLFLPDVMVVGFIGRNTSAKVTHVYTQSKGAYHSEVIDLVTGGILFKNGVAIEFAKTPLFLAIEEVPSFIRKFCSFSTGQIYFPHSQIALKPELLKSLAYGEVIPFALQQYETIQPRKVGFFAHENNESQDLVPRTKEVSEKKRKNKEVNRQVKASSSSNIKGLEPKGKALFSVINRNDDENENEECLTSEGSNLEIPTLK